MAIMAAGGLLVAGLIGWAMTRTVEPAPAAATSTVASSPAAIPAAGTPPLTTDGSAPAPAPTPARSGEPSSVARISVEDLRAQVGRGDVTVIDVRDAASFATSHIPGALNMPLASIEGQIDLIPKGKPIVTYCT